MLESKENAIEFLYGSKRATGTFCSPKFVNKLKKLAEDKPDECQIVAENPDGSIVAHFPVKWVKINVGSKGRKFTEEEKIAAAERLAIYRERRMSK